MADPMQDRNYLLALMQRGPHDVMAQVAAKQWELLNQREAQGAQHEATRANLEEQIRSREEAQGLNREQLQQRAEELADYRANLMAQRGTEAEERSAARTLASIPSILEAYPGPEGQKRAQQVLNQYLSRQGITAPTTAPDAATAAIQRVQGKPPTGAPPAAPGVDQARLNQALLESRAMPGTVGRPEGGTPPTAAPTAGGRRIATPTGSIAAPVEPSQIERMIAATPPGMAFSAERGGYIPATTQGTIGGRAAGDVLAEGALRTGITPESESGKAALAARLSKGGLPFYTKTTEPGGAAAAETPVKPPGVASQSREATRPKVDLGSIGRSIGNLFGGEPTAPTFGGRGTGAGSEWSPEQLARGPVPEPTPSGTPPVGPFSGSYTAGAPQPPEPTPAGTPPAQPPPPISDEELRKRLAAQQQTL
jgi:hypothetical protein